MVYFVSPEASTLMVFRFYAKEAVKTQRLQLEGEDVYHTMI